MAQIFEVVWDEFLLKKNQFYNKINSSVLGEKFKSESKYPSSAVNY